MIGNMNNGYATGSEIIEGFYEAENMNASNEVESTKITVKLSVDSAAMFNAIASRFGNSRFQLLEAHFDTLATQMFNSLSDSDKEELSKIADKEATEVLKKQGLKTWMTSGAAGTFENENATWRNYLALSKTSFASESERSYSEKVNK